MRLWDCPKTFQLEKLPTSSLFSGARMVPVHVQNDSFSASSPLPGCYHEAPWNNAVANREADVQRLLSFTKTVVGEGLVFVGLSQRDGDSGWLLSLTIC